MPLRDWKSPLSVLMRVFGIDQIASMLQQPLHAVLEVRSFLVRRERQDNVAPRCPALALPADEIRGEDGGTILDVLRPAAVEIAVAFRQSEWIEARGPVLGTRLDDIEMGQEKNRLLTVGAVADPRNRATRFFFRSLGPIT